VSRWTDLAQWRPSEAHGGEMHEHRGLVLHIAEGFYEGTLAWQHDKANKVSSHFVVGRLGQLAQVVDTDESAWTQRSGNGHWLSLECEGFTLGHKLHKQHPDWHKLSGAQIEAAAHLLVRAHQQYGVPIQVAVSSAGRGLGHHSMGGVEWGHLDCPGDPIIQQKAAILTRAKSLMAQQHTRGPVPMDWRNETVKAINFFYAEAFRASQGKAASQYPKDRPATDQEKADRAARNAFVYTSHADGVDPEPTDE
jgi:hypothetical protein